MSQEKIDTLRFVDRVQQMVLRHTPTQGFSPTASMNEASCSMLGLSVLAAHCLTEIDNCRRGEPYTERYGLELLHRALRQSDQEAWTWVQHCFEGMVYDWVRCHPQRAVACRLESEENFVAQAFERFWQATAYNQQLKFKSLAAALQYLRASVNGAILDTLRTSQRPGEVSLSESGAPGEPSMEDMACGNELWDILKGLFSNPREKRLAYLLFYCGLKPWEVMHYCSPEWSSVGEIYVLQHTIMERVLRHVDFLRWRLS